MSHFPSMCCSSPLNPQVLFYDVRTSHFDDRALNVLRIKHIQYFILKAGDYVYDQPNNNLKNFYSNTRMNWMRNHGNLKFTPPHMNYILVET